MEGLLRLRDHAAIYRAANLAFWLSAVPTSWLGRRLCHLRPCRELSDQGHRCRGKKEPPDTRNAPKKRDTSRREEQASCRAGYGDADHKRTKWLCRNVS